jgi:hypothetical protein
MLKKTTTHPITRGMTYSMRSALQEPRYFHGWIHSLYELNATPRPSRKSLAYIRLTKINKIIAKQITDNEKLTISTLNSTYSAIKIQDGAYDITELIQLLAQNATSFTKAYQPTEHQRITRYLKTREQKSGFTTNATQSPSGKGKGGKPNNKRKANTTTLRIQRAWGYLQEGQTSSLVSPPPYSKGKGKSGYKGKGESKGKGKPKGKGKTWSKGQNHGKGTSTSGKGKSKGISPKDKRLPKGNPCNLVPTATSSSTNATTATPTPVRCHFCHLVGHIKPNCRKWLALQHSDQYKTRHTHDQRYRLIYDHLEDSVLAPWHCPYCSDPSRQLPIHLRPSGLSRRFNIFHIHNQHIGTQCQTRTTFGQPCTPNRLKLRL